MNFSVEGMARLGLLWTVMAVALAACDSADQGRQAPALDAQALTGVTLYFEEQEAGIEPYGVRMLVTPAFLRIDDGVDEGDFILYDRNARTIMSVNHEDESVLAIYHRGVSLQPESPLELTTEETVDPEAPAIGGIAPVHYRFLTNDTVCYEVIAVSGLLEDARAAMSEYLETLAGEQALNLDHTPVELRHACMLSNLIFAPTRHLAQGFPIQEWDYQGYSRALLDYEAGQTYSAELFEVPGAYRVYSINPR